jgi:hypothetical protein
VKFRSILLSLTLLFATPAWAVWTDSESATAANCMNTSSATNRPAMRPGTVCFWIITSATNTDIVNMSNCGSVSMELNTAGSMTAQPQSCEQAATNCNDLTTPLNGSTAGGWTQIGAIESMRALITWSSGSGTLKIVCGL